jgi:hypothetical protein
MSPVRMPVQPQVGSGCEYSPVLDRATLQSVIGLQTPASPQKVDLSWHFGNDSDGAEDTDI